MAIMRNLLQRIKISGFDKKRIGEKNVLMCVDFINRNSLYLDTPIVLSNRKKTVFEINQELKSKIREDVYVGMKYRFQNGRERVLHDSIFNDTFFVQWGSFQDKTTEEVKRLLSLCPSKNIILDLRGNMGGKVENTVEIANFFLDGGEICTLKYKKKENVFQASTGCKKFDKIICFIDKNTMSSAEILYLSLYLNLKNVWLIGNKSYGKYQGQVVYHLPSFRDVDCYVTAFEWSVLGVDIREIIMETDNDKRMIYIGEGQDYMTEAARLLNAL